VICGSFIRVTNGFEKVAQLCNFFILAACQAGVAHGRPRARVPDLVGSRLPRPYQFRARIQSFQAVAAPFPGDSVLPSGAISAIETPRFKRSTIGSTIPAGMAGIRTNIERLRNFGRKFVERLGSYATFRRQAVSIATLLETLLRSHRVKRLKTRNRDSPTLFLRTGLENAIPTKIGAGLKRSKTP
jgi:hypothetical protein